MKDLEIRQELEKLSGWSWHKERIEKTFEFNSFARAAVFFNKIVNPIEEQDHHPEIVINYNRVKISLFTHDVGAITEKDFKLAHAIENLSGHQQKV